MKDPENGILRGFIDMHIHTSPDLKPRLLDDYEAALEAKENGMRAIVLKSHIESTVGRAYIAHRLTGFQVFGGIALNKTVGGLNQEAVRNAALMGARIVWLPTIHHHDIKMEQEPLQDILHLIKEYNLVLATGHLKPQEIFSILDDCRSVGVGKILINHPLTGVVGASLDEQKEMAHHAYLEHCWVATMPQHDALNPTIMVDAIKEIGAQRCVLATDFGQKHNPSPVLGMLLMIESMIKNGISWREVEIMCKNNPEKLLF